MANNYCQTSFILDCKSKEARDDVYAFAMALIDPENYQHDDVDGNEFSEDYFGGGSIDIDGNTSLWFCGEESFDESWFDFVICYALKKYKLPPMGFTWASTCSKMRVDEFDGGATVYWYDPETDTVKSDSISGWRWVAEQIKQIKGE